MGLLHTAEGERHLKWVNGALSFSELKSETTLESEMGNGPLYMVNVNFDVKNFDAAKGVTILFDKKAHALRMDEGLNPSQGVAWGHMIDNLDKTGWIELYITTTDSTAMTNDVKVFAAGFLEGILTGPRISQFYSNAHQLMLKDEANMHAIRNVRTQFFREVEYVKKQSNIHGGVMSIEPPDPYWKHVRYTFMQIWGIKDAYNFLALTHAVHMIDLVDMLVINSNGEIPELMEAYTPIAVAERRAYQEPKLFLQQEQNTTREELAEIQRFWGRKRRQGGLGSSRANARSSASALKPEEGPGPASRQPEAHARMMVDFKKPTQPAKRTMPPPAARSLLTTESTPDGLVVTGDNGQDQGPGNTTQTTDKKADRAWEEKLQHGGRCSAFVRVGPENKDLYVGHTTWDDFSKMTRIFKYYHFKLPGSWAMATHIAMSSYPGCVSSTDDYYLLNSGLVVTDTSLEILNPKIYDRIREFPSNPHIPNFMHIMACNRMARTANQWTVLMSERNSGTNNAQWMVVDYNLFKPGSPLPDNVFWVLEQIPGQLHKSDMSGHLRSAGWWASYNRPYFPEIRTETGHAAAEGYYGALFSYASGPRATIFKRVGGSVSSLFDMRNLMNRNEYPNEGILPNDPGHSISARMDLDIFGNVPNGGIDAKVTNRCLFRSLQVQAISGPSHSTQAVFRWKDGDKELFGGWPHLGLPDVWDFDWVQMTPSKALTSIVDVNSC